MTFSVAKRGLEWLGDSFQEGAVKFFGKRPIACNGASILSSTKREITARIKQEVERSVIQQQNASKRQNALMRLDYLQQGMRAYKKRQLIEAIHFYESYLKLLEVEKNVAIGGLTPDLFFSKNEMVDLFTLNGLYWDLVKAYDRSKTGEKEKKFVHYLEKFILFSKGMPFQHLSAELLRKYIQYRRPVHRQALRLAYERIGSARCFIASALIDVIQPSTLPVLRSFRDQCIPHSKLARFWIRSYYRLAPGVASLLKYCPLGGRLVLGKALDRLALGLKRRFSIKVVDGPELMNEFSTSIDSEDELCIGEIDPKR